MAKESFELPIYWNDYEDIAMGLYEKFGDDFGESQIYRIRFTELLDWILSLPNFAGTREQSNEGHLGANPDSLGLRVAR
jgi:FeS assembly protein IscX